MMGHTSPTGLAGQYRVVMASFQRDRWFFKSNNDGPRKRWNTLDRLSYPDPVIASVSA